MFADFENLQYSNSRSIYHSTPTWNRLAGVND